MNRHRPSLLLLLTILLAVWPADPGLALTTAEKMRQVEEMFRSRFSEEMYYRTDRLLLTATKRNMSLRKAPANATVITAREIRRMGARTLQDVLFMTPGFGISVNEQGVKMFEVRGIRTKLSEKLLVMIDGHLLNRNYVGSALAYTFDDLDLEMVKRIEIVRGPGSALYGANAFLGVINIITKESDDIDGLELTSFYGSFDRRQINLTAGTSFQDLEVMASASYWKNPGASLDIDRDALTGSGYSAAPGAAGTGFEQSDFFVKLRYRDFSFRGQYLTKQRGTLVGFNYALTDDNYWQIDTFWGELGYQHALTNDLDLTAKVFFDQFGQDPSLELYPEGYLGKFPNGVIGQPRLKDRTRGCELQLDYDLATVNHLIVGAAYETMDQFDVRHVTNYDPNTSPPEPLGSLQDISATGNFNRDASRETWAFYLQDQWALTGNLDLTAGGRFDHYSDFGDTFNPRLALVWGLLDNVDLKLLYGEAFRAPNFVELYNANNPVIVGNPRLQPEEIKTYEATLGIVLSPSLYTSLGYFFNDIDQLIVWDTSSSPGRYTNRGGAEVDGLEWLLTGRFPGGTAWKLSYTYQDPRDAVTKARLADVPSQRATATLDYPLNHTLDGHLDILWSGRRPRAAGDSRSDLPAYTIVNLGLLARDFPHPNLSLQAMIRNLFDKRYRDPDTSGSQQLIPDDFPSEGITATLAIRYRF